MIEDYDYDFLGDIDPKELEKAAKAAKDDMRADGTNENVDAKESRGYYKEGSEG